MSAFILVCLMSVVMQPVADPGVSSSVPAAIDETAIITPVEEDFPANPGPDPPPEPQPLGPAGDGNPEDPPPDAVEPVTWGAIKAAFGQ
jgi:hypothetical protein